MTLQGGLPYAIKGSAGRSAADTHPMEGELLHVDKVRKIEIPVGLYAGRIVRW